MQCIKEIEQTPKGELGHIEPTKRIEVKEIERIKLVQLMELIEYVELIKNTV